MTGHLDLQAQYLRPGDVILRRMRREVCAVEAVTLDGMNVNVLALSYRDGERHRFIYHLSDNVPTVEVAA